MTLTMKLEIFSAQNDLLELTVWNTRPQMNVGELNVNGECTAWHCQWVNLPVRNIAEPYEIVKERIEKFYNDENLSSQVNGTTLRKPGYARISSDKEEYLLHNCKIISATLNDMDKSAFLELNFDGVSYKTL